MSTQPLPLAPAVLVRATPTLAVGADGLPLGIAVATTRAYDYATGLSLAIGATSARSTAITATEVMLHASSRCFVRVGDSSVNAANGAGSFPLEAGEKFHLRITSGQRIAVIRDSADGALTILPVL